MADQAAPMAAGDEQQRSAICSTWSATPRRCSSRGAVKRNRGSRTPVLMARRAALSSSWAWKVSSPAPPGARGWHVRPLPARERLIRSVREAQELETRTGANSVAQTAAKSVLEPIFEVVFCPDLVRDQARTQSPGRHRTGRGHSSTSPCLNERVIEEVVVTASGRVPSGSLDRTGARCWVSEIACPGADPIVPCRRDHA